MESCIILHYIYIYVCVVFFFFCIFIVMYSYKHTNKKNYNFHVFLILIIIIFFYISGEETMQCPIPLYFPRSSMLKCSNELKKRIENLSLLLLDKLGKERYRQCGCVN